jgi:hypothetical protein
MLANEKSVQKSQVAPVFLPPVGDRVEMNDLRRYKV